MSNKQQSGLTDGPIFQTVMKLALPIMASAFLSAAYSITDMAWIGLLGSKAVAGVGVGAMYVWLAQNFGAGKIDRVKKGYRVSAIAMLVWGTLIGALFVIFPEQISGIFLHEPEVIATAVPYFIIVGLAEPFMCVELMAVGAISGLGNTRLCSIISIMLTGLRIPLAFVLSRTGLGVDGIWWALSLTSILKGIVLHLAFGRTLKKYDN